MPLPTIAETLRCAIHLENPAVTDKIINVIHITNGDGVDPSDANSALQDAWAAMAGPAINSDWRWTKVSYTQLDGSATIELPWTSTQPTNATQGMATNVAMCMSWRSAFAGRRFRGRSYLGDLGFNVISGTSPNLIATTQLAAADARGSDFISTMSAAAHSLLVASYVDMSSTNVIREVTNPRVCTMRKRANGR